MYESKWLPLSQEVIAPSSHPTDASWATESPSSYDVPSHIRSSFDPDKGSLIIEFRYIEQEPQVDIPLGEYVIARVGKRSQRIWSLLIDVHALDRDRKRLADIAVDSIESLPENKARNRLITARAISAKRNFLIDERYAVAM